MPVFLAYEQAALELQYNSAARDPALNARRDANAAHTEALNRAARAALPCRRDIAYGAHPRERFDLYPADRPASPAVVFIHGGYWKSRDKDQFAWLARPFLEQGVSFIAMGYPLCPDVRMTALAGSVRRGLAHIARDAAALGLDPRGLVVTGHSAGAHLAALTLATDWQRYGCDRPPVRAVTAVSGLYDLRPLALVAVNADLKLDAAEIEALSPLFLPPRVKAPLCLTVGDEEAAEFIRNAGELARAWAAAGIPLTTLPAPGRYHFDVLTLFNTPGEPLFEWTLAAARGA